MSGQCTETYRAPSGETYRGARVVYRGDQIACRAFPEIPLAVDEILG